MKNELENGCIGEHLPHSFSREIHEQIGAYSYELKELAPEELPVEGYETLTAEDTVLYGSARVDVTKDNMADYDF